MHAFIFWGFLILLPTIVEAMLAIVDPDWTLPYLGHAPWFLFLVDLFATLVIVGVAIAFSIRKVQRPARFEGSHMGEADRILLDDPRDRRDAPAVERVADRARALRRRRAAGVGRALRPVRRRAAEAAERVFVWLHLLIVLGFLTYLPRSKHLHIITAAPNVFFAKNGPTGRLEPRADRPRGPRGGPAVRRRDRRRTCRRSSCSTCSAAPSAGGARRSARRGRPASRSAPSS